MTIIYLLLGLLIGALIIWLFYKSKNLISSQEAEKFKEKINQLELEINNLENKKSSLNEQLTEKKSKLADFSKKIEAQNQNIIQLTDEKSKAESENKILTENLETTEKKLSISNNKIEDLNKQLTELQTTNNALKDKLVSEKKEIQQIQTNFKDAFENLANKIFEDKSQSFVDLNKTNIDEILRPLKENIEKFQSKVETAHEKTLEKNTELIQQIKNLEKLNQKISDDAKNLTKALKGDVKTQGNWGEVILERILENSGLKEGVEYYPQAKGMKLKTETGGTRKPDIVVNLPDNKHMIIDAKVSLIAYEKFMNSDDKQKRQKYARDLVNSVKAHVKNLEKKHYTQLKGLNSPDFVLLFMPIEGSFSVVGREDNSMFRYALDRNIVIVSPTTLLATLRTIAYIWQQENQTKNAKEIARQSGNLYDKFVGFLEDFEKISYHIDKTRGSYQKALNKLKTGKGNLIRRANKIRELGAEAGKQIPSKFEED